MPATRPDLTFPDAEANHVRAAYRDARAILEYGSGGSTVVAAEMAGKYVLSVESDRDWAMQLQLYLDDANPPSPATVWHVDIGETGDWGRPRDHRAWRQFPNYALGIWDEPFFRHPDVILIDGRFRAACLMAALLRVERPVRVLFDDYFDRDRYHVVEEVIRPSAQIGRMAEFAVAPGQASRAALTQLVTSFSDANFAETDARKPADPVADPVGRPG